MKKQFLQIIIFITAMVAINSCKDPLPVELTPQEDDLQVKILSPDPAEFIYSNGYDSTGITLPVPPKSAMILVNDIKNTIGDRTFESSNYSAVFFDRQNPIKNRNGKIVGFKTRALGKTFFNGDSAKLIPLRFRFKEGGNIVDTLAGLQHKLRLAGRRNGNNNSHIKFRLNFSHGQHLKFNIVTPPEVTGNVNVVGEPGNANFRMELTWDKANTIAMEIIIGGVLKNRNETYPLYEIKTKDDGLFRVPGNLLQNIPYDKFNNLVITFIRRFKTEIGNNSINDNFVTAHNIHNIRIPVP